VDQEFKDGELVERARPARMTEVLAKLQESFTWGVPHVWLIHPRTRQFSRPDRAGLHHVKEFAVPNANRAMTAADIFH